MNLWRSIIWPNENYIQFLQFFLFHVSIFITSIFIQNSPKQSLHNTSCITNRYLACPTKNQHYFRIALTEYDLSQIFSTSIPQTFIRNPFHFHPLMLPFFAHEKRKPTISQFQSPQHPNFSPRFSATNKRRSKGRFRRNFRGLVAGEGRHRSCH